MVQPAASRPGGVERYTVVVPTEGTSPTVRVDLRLPMGVEVAALEPKPGWQASHEPFPIGAATLSWSGGRIAPAEMATFEFLALNPTAARELTWNAIQWYEDGTSDRWGEGAPAEHHASTTTLVAAPQQALSPDPSSAAALWIALVALALSLTALLVAVVGGRAGNNPDRRS